MTPKGAYDKLAEARPVIPHVLRRDRDTCPSAAVLAERTYNSDDDEETRRLIALAAEYVWQAKD